MLKLGKSLRLKVPLPSLENAGREFRRVGLGNETRTEPWRKVDLTCFWLPFLKKIARIFVEDAKKLSV